jgi:hypothetical protein
MTDDCYHADTTEFSALVPLRFHDVMFRIKLITHKIIVEWWKFDVDNTSQNEMKVVIIVLNTIWL